jgi:hypothetical protein
MCSVIDELNARFGALIKENISKQSLSAQSIGEFKAFINELTVEKSYSFWEHVIDPIHDEEEAEQCRKMPEALLLLDKLSETRHQKLDIECNERKFLETYKLAKKEERLQRKLCSLFVENGHYFFYPKDLEGDCFIFYFWSGCEQLDEILAEAIIEGQKANYKKHLDFLLNPVKI